MLGAWQARSTFVSLSSMGDQSDPWRVRSPGVQWIGVF